MSRLSSFRSCPIFVRPVMSLSPVTIVSMYARITRLQESHFWNAFWGDGNGFFAILESYYLLLEVKSHSSDMPLWARFHSHGWIFSDKKHLDYKKSTVCAWPKGWYTVAPNCTNVRKQRFLYPTVLSCYLCLYGLRNIYCINHKQF